MFILRRSLFALLMLVPFVGAIAATAPAPKPQSQPWYCYIITCTTPDPCLSDPNGCGILN